MNYGADESILGSRRARPGRRKVAVGIVGGALVAIGVVCWLTSGGGVKQARALGANLPIDSNASDPRNISANNSPVLARNPADPGNLVVANRIDLPSYSCALHASFDAGSTWSAITVPFPDGEELPARCYAPDVAYSPDGTLHVAYVTLKGEGNNPNAVWVASSANGGRTLSTPVRAAGRLAFQVRLSADISRPGRLYLTWLQADKVGTLLFPNTGNPIQTARSDDSGSTWSAPVRVSPSGRLRVVAPSPAIGPQGQLYVLYLDLGDDRLDYAGAHQGRGGDPYQGTWTLILAHSTDQGQTWRETVVDAGVQPTQRFIIFLPPTPDLAVDPHSGQLYATFADNQHGDADVWVWTSEDDGQRFAARRRVNDTRERDGTAQYLPKLAVASNGRLDVIYYDRRNDSANIMNEVSLQSSTDQGRSFSPRVTITDARFDSRVGPGSERDLADLGSRLALLSGPQRALAVWTDTRAGSDITGKQDLARAVIQIPMSRSPGFRARSVSLVLITVGLLLAACTNRLAARWNGPRTSKTHSRPPVSSL